MKGDPRNAKNNLPRPHQNNHSLPFNSRWTPKIGSSKWKSTCGSKFTHPGLVHWSHPPRTLPKVAVSCLNAPSPSTTAPPQPDSLVGRAHNGDLHMTWVFIFSLSPTPPLPPSFLSLFFFFSFFFFFFFIFIVWLFLLHTTFHISLYSLYIFLCSYCFV